MGQGCAGVGEERIDDAGGKYGHRPRHGFTPTGRRSREALNYASRPGS